MRVLVGLLLAFVMLQGVCSARLVTGPLPIRVAVGAKRFSQFATFATSPDGRLVAYDVQDGTRVNAPGLGTASTFTRTGVPFGFQGSDVFVTDTATRKTTLVAGGPSSNWNPVWSHGGRSLAYLSDEGGAPHLWVWDRSTGRSRQVSTAVVHAFANTPVLWVDGDTKVLAPILPADMTLADADAYETAYLTGAGPSRRVSHATVRVYAFDPKAPGSAAALARLNGYAGGANGTPYDYALIDLETGHATRIVRHATAAGVSVSDDGRFAALVTLVGAAADARDQDLYDIDVVSMADGRRVSALHRVPMAANWTPIWRPGHDAFAYTTGSRSLALASKQSGPIGETYLFSVPGGRRERITNGAHVPFGMYHQSFAWSDDGSRLVYTADGRAWIVDVRTATVRQGPRIPSNALSIVLDSNHRIPGRGNQVTLLVHDDATQQDGFDSVDLRSGRVAKVLQADQAIGGYERTFAALGRAGASIDYVAQSAAKPPDIWSVGISGATPVQLTHLNPALERYRYGTTRIVRWSVGDQQFSGALMLPSDYVPGHRYPTIVYQYPNARETDNVNIYGGSDGIGNFQLYATRGYAVFMPDMNLKAFTSADLTNGVALRWLDAMLDRLVAIGVADDHRFALEGESFGGYSTLAFITQTHRFRAAISDSGFSSMFSIYGELEANGDAFYVSQTEREAGGTPWKALDRYISMSPFFKLDQVTTPVLLVQGSGAIWLQQQEADQTFVALRRLNKEVAYALYLGEGHTRASFTYDHALDYWKRAIDWYDRHLKD